MKIPGLLLIPFAHKKVKGELKCYPQQLFAQTVFFDSQWQKPLANNFSHCSMLVYYFPFSTLENL
jgi:hypothetical protein